MIPHPYCRRVRDAVRRMQKLDIQNRRWGENLWEDCDFLDGESMSRILSAKSEKNTVCHVWTAPVGIVKVWGYFRQSWSGRLKFFINSKCLECGKQLDDPVIMEGEKDKCMTLRAWCLVWTFSLNFLGYEIDFYKQDTNALTGCCDDPAVQIRALRVDFERIHARDPWWLSR